MRRTFAQDQLEESFDNDGFNIVDLLTSDEVTAIRRGVEDLGFRADSEERFRITINQETAERKERIYERFTPIFQGATSAFLRDYTVMRIAIFDKLPGGGVARMHQHPHIVDEAKYRSLTTWVPLVDTSVAMGTLHVIRGSHRIFVHKTRTHNDYRAFAGVSMNVAREYSMPVLLKAGQAIIFDDRLIHWSPANQSADARTAFQVALMPKEIDSSLTVYYRDNWRTVSKYVMSPDTYRRSAITLQRPEELKFVVHLREPYVSYGNRQLRTMMRGFEPSHAYLRRSLVERLFRI
jgi:ectoine hydroxylase-related dioxygenase (phytanoyl-CoA dioxygenase family)